MTTSRSPIRTVALSVVAAALACVSAAVPAQRLVEMDTATTDARVVIFPYVQDKLYLAYVQVNTDARINFARGETVVFAQVDKPSSFTLTTPKDRSFLIIQPNFADVNGHLTVRTRLADGSERFYDLELTVTKPGQKHYRLIRWTPPSTGASIDLADAGNAPAAQAPTAAQIASAVVAATAAARQSEASDPQQSKCADEMRMSPADLDFGYTITGDAAFRPVSVFSDRARTYFRMPDRLAELPALLASDGDGSKLLNYSICPPLLIAQGALERFELRLGKKSVTISKAGAAPATTSSFWGGFKGSTP